jgi:small subunit ribosomal protein S8e
MPEVAKKEVKAALVEKKAKHFQEWREGKETEGEKQFREQQERRHRGVKEETKRNDNKHPFSDHLEKLHHFFELMNKGRILAKITSRPGQCGRADGYLLEGKELDFYSKKMEKK